MDATESENGAMIKAYADFFYNKCRQHGAKELFICVKVSEGMYFYANASDGFLMKIMDAIIIQVAPPGYLGTITMDAKGNCTGIEEFAEKLHELMKSKTIIDEE